MGSKILLFSAELTGRNQSQSLVSSQLPELETSRPGAGAICYVPACGVSWAGIKSHSHKNDRMFDDSRYDWTRAGLTWEHFLRWTPHRMLVRGNGLEREREGV